MLGGERGQDRDERGGGSKGIGLAIGGIIVAFFTTMSFVLVVLLYVFMTIYAIVRAIGPGAGENPVTIVIGFVLISTLFAVLLGVSIHFVGRTITPKKLRDKA